MREILFRGKQCYTGKWVYGYLSEDGCGLPVIETARFRSAVEPDTIGQSTGLTDKNGKRIFEGDIVEGHDFLADDDGYGVVNWDDGGFLISNGYLCGSFVENYNGRDFEVIGNIHDNPELAEGE